MRIGIFYGSTSYGTKEAAVLVRDEFARQAPEAVVDLSNVAGATAHDLAPYDLLVLGTSTWGLGGLQHDWDGFIRELRRADLSGTTAAVFALGDQVVWSETFVNSLATVYDTAAARGATMVGSWPTDGYAFDRSESVRHGRFLGLALDRMNQRELIPERVRRWVGQVLAEQRAVAGQRPETAGVEAIVAQAPAKVNLSLLVGPRRADGYHELFTVFAPLDLHDTLEFRLAARPAAPGEAAGRPPGSGAAAPRCDADTPGTPDVLTVSCPGVPSEANLVTRALRLVEQETGWLLTGRVDVRKRIPTGAGLGGGSSDAAAALRAGAQVLAGAGGPRLGEDTLRAFAGRLGADVPFFLDPRPALAGGVGDALHPLPLPSLPLVLFLPREELSTARVYAEFDRLGQPASAGAFLTRADQQAERWRGLSDAWRAGRLGHGEVADLVAGDLLANDLEQASRSLLPCLGERAEMLRERGALGVLMAGSGSTMFGLWKTEAEAVEAALLLSNAGHTVAQVHTTS
jgi:flavodoxin long chain